MDFGDCIKIPYVFITHRIRSFIRQGSGYTVKGGNTVKIVVPSFSKGIYSERKEFAPLERICSPGEQILSL